MKVTGSVKRPLWKRWVLPLAPLAVATALCTGFGENFPFSHFPMYSGFSDKANYVYLADGDGAPVPVESITYIRTGRLKKVFQGELKKRAAELDEKWYRLTPEERRGAGDRTLQWLYDSTRPGGKPFLETHGTLRLYNVDIQVDGAVIRSAERELVGEIPVARQDASS